MRYTETTTRIAVDIDTGEEYQVEYPSLKVIRNSILELNYPPEGITAKDMENELADLFGLTPEQRNAVSKVGNPNSKVFYYNLVYQAIMALVRTGKLEQPDGPRTPYFLVKEGQEPKKFTQVYKAEKTIRKAVDPDTGEKYRVEYPSLEVIRNSILELDYPPEGITAKNTVDELADHFGLTADQRFAVDIIGKQRDNVFHKLIRQVFRDLLLRGELEQPGGRGTPYFLKRDEPIIKRVGDAISSIVKIGKSEQPGGTIKRNFNKEVEPVITEVEPVIKQEEPISANETIDQTYQRIREELSEKLLVQIKNNSSDFFEELVIDLLYAMGYGGSIKEAKKVGRASDGGIAGIINEDKLGLDAVYVQAKLWDEDVGEHRIKYFVETLDRLGAQKGIFITTSGFSTIAKEFAEQSAKKIVLIDGYKLTQYMIDHNIGVQITKSYDIKRVDSDYFSNDK